MIEKIIQFSLRQRLIALLILLGIISAGIYSYRQLAIDAFPDVSPVVVQIFTESPGLAPEEVEQLITYPIEVAMNGLPDIEQIKSISQFGLSVVSVYFKDHVDIYFARQLVAERLNAAEEDIPMGLGNPGLGPITSGLGQVFKYRVEGEGYSLTELREIQDWVVKFQLQTIPGVTEILSYGGHVKQYQIQIDPNSLLKYDMTLDEVIEALQTNNKNVGGSFIRNGSEEYLIRGIGFVKTLDDLQDIKIGIRNGIPIYVKDVADVKYGPEIRRGLVSLNGEGEIVTGIILKLLGENTSKVLERVNKKIDEINQILPEGVRVVPFYDQGELVEKATSTVIDSLLIGGVLVMVVLLLFLGNLRTAFIVVLSLPFSLFVAFFMMNLRGMSANLMSLGGLAIGIGMMVDGTIVMVENIYRHLTERNSDNNGSVFTIIRESAREVGRPITFAVSIIIIVFLPLFTLQGVEGKMFSPTAFTISFAMAGSLLFALLFAPMLASFLLKGKLKQKENKLVKALNFIYIPALKYVLKTRKVFLSLMGGLLVVTFFLFSRLGTEFVPQLDEGAIAIRVTMSPSIAIEEAAKIANDLEKRLVTFPEVKDVFSQNGRAEVGGDPEQISNTEIFITLKPRDQWQVKNKAELIEKMEHELSDYPGILLNFTQPIAMRVDELLSGVKAQLAINLFGDDLDVLFDKANEINGVVRKIKGAADVQVEQAAGRFYIQIKVDRKKIARYGLNVDEVMEIVETAIGGSSVGQVFEGVKRFDIFVRYKERYRKDVDHIKNILVSTPSGERIPLSQLAEIERVVGPNQISRDNSQRRIVIQLNVRGRDMGSFVEEARQTIAQQVTLPIGYYVEFGGQFENQKRAMARLSLIVPITIFLIFLMLFKSFDSVRNAFLIILNLPFAIVGGVLGLMISGEYLSVPSAIGFIALFGIAVENGIVMVEYFNQLRREGKDIEYTLLTGAKLRLRPVLMTALTTALGLIPLLLSTGIGSEVQRPLAVVVVSGLFTATISTLFILPSLYEWLEKRTVEF